MRALVWLVAPLALAACASSGGDVSASLRYQPGIAYYSDDFSLEGDVYRLGEEKNLEEVYQYYAYYEAVHDEQGRVATFEMYQRGDLAWSEHYRYDRKGRLLERRRIRPGRPAEVTRFDR
jgi:hypothetical protein